MYIISGRGRKSGVAHATEATASLVPLPISMVWHCHRHYFNKFVYVRDSCGKTFSSAGNLRKHIKFVYNGQKDHKCASCEKAFSEATDLKGQINSVHNGQKDHKCGNLFSSIQFTVVKNSTN